MILIEKFPTFQLIYKFQFNYSHYFCTENSRVSKLQTLDCELKGDLFL
jgi:hypothetical protein